MKVYKTSEVAKIIGIHPNTVRLYEEWGLIPRPERLPNGYRVFTELHIDQLQLARTAFQVEVLQNGLRKKISSMVGASASGDFDRALMVQISCQLQRNRNAEEAINIVTHFLEKNLAEDGVSMKRREVSEYLDISMDTLRNWEMNGLLKVRRRQNGYRIYTGEDINRLKVIRSLRCANYSLEAILRMLTELSSDPRTNLEKALNIPENDSEIVSVCDRLIISLQQAAANADIMISQIEEMKLKHQ
ncbi:MAG: MerR family transcriptional regulator [Eisenbergiella sp.]